MTTTDLTTDPVTILEQRQHAIANRAAELGIQLRQHLAAATSIRRELAELTTTAKSTNALLAIHRAVAAIPPKNTATADTPATTEDQP